MARNEHFAEVSPELGELDEDALTELLDDDLDAGLELLGQLARATDKQLAVLARRLAGRLVLELARTGPARGRGIGRLTAGRFEAGLDLDVDASVDALVRQRVDGVVDPDELRARRWQRPDTSICLLVDRSGSMDGLRLATAALAAAACLWRAPGACSVVAFSSTAVSVVDADRPRRPDEVVSDVLRLVGRGTTDVALALRAAQRQHDRTLAKRRITVLLSDAEVTAGVDPVPWARRCDELVVMAPTDAPDHAGELARASGARFTTIDGPASIPGAFRTTIS